MREKSYPVLKIKKSLQKIDAEVTKLKELTKGIPGVQKNIDPIMAFIDVLKFHIGDLKDKE